jgi:uncharacterized protein
LAQAEYSASAPMPRGENSVHSLSLLVPARDRRERQLTATTAQAFRLGIAATAVYVLLALSAAAEPRFPPLTGRVVDAANLLTPEDRRGLENELRALEERSTDQLVVYTTSSLQGYPIEDIGYRLGRAWAIGQKGKDNGIILIVAPNERRVRIEVGRGLEPQLTDVMTKLIIENAILPAFRRNDFSAGIKAGVHDIRDVLLGDAAAVKERAARSASRAPGSGAMPVMLLAVLILIAVAIVFAQSLGTANPQRVRDDRRRRRFAGPAGWGGAGWGSSAGGWGSGGGGWDGGSGGGFSGGGGDFGGGGSSGSW